MKRRSTSFRWFALALVCLMAFTRVALATQDCHLAMGGGCEALPGMEGMPGDGDHAKVCESKAASTSKNVGMSVESDFAQVAPALPLPTMFQPELPVIAVVAAGTGHVPISVLTAFKRLLL